jgi:hypothetical protein
MRLKEISSSFTSIFMDDYIQITRRKSNKKDLPSFHLARAGIFHLHVSLSRRRAMGMPVLGLAEQGARIHCVQVMPGIDP